MSFSTSQGVVVNMYYITLYVTKGQEEAIQSLYKEKGWTYLKAAAPMLSSISPIVLPNGVGYLPNPGQPHTLVNKTNSPNTPVSTPSSSNTGQFGPSEPAKSNQVGKSKTAANQINESKPVDNEVDHSESDRTSDTTDDDYDNHDDDDYNDDDDLDDDTDSYSPEIEENTSKTVVIKREVVSQDRSFICMPNQNAMVKCDTCHLYLSEEDDQKEHKLLDCYKLMEESKIDIGYKCGKCKISFITSDSFIWHFVNKTCDLKLCIRCGIDNSDLETFLKHQGTTCCTILYKTEKWDEKYMCNSCKTMFKDLNVYMRHNLMGFCTGLNYICDFCGKIMHKRKNRACYNQHLRTHLNDRPYQCKECGKAYIEWKTLRNHMRKHTGEKPFKCRYENCTKFFQTAGHRIGHEMSNHRDIPKSQVCHVCGAAFKFVSGLNSHIKLVHSDERNFSCDICSKMFKSKGMLSNHLLTHRTVKDHVCDICGKGFVSTKHLNPHMRRHKNEKNHICGTCGKAFLTRQYLVMHERIHTGDKPYHCRLCDYRCAVKQNLNKHIRGVHGKDNPSMYVERISC